MRLDEFRRINLKVFKNDNIIYEGEAESIPEELKCAQTKEIKIQPGLAVVTIEDVIDNTVNE